MQQLNHLFSAKRIAAVVVAAFLILTGLPARAAVYNWTNTLGGNWSNTNNWSPNQVPSTNDTANITATGNYTVSLDINPTIVGLVLGASSGVTTQIFSMGGKSLTVNGTIQVNAQGQFNFNGGTLAGASVLTGTLTWSAGTMAGSMTMPSNSVLNIAGAGNMLYFDSFALTNYGTVNWTNSTLEGLNDTNAQIYNYGTWNAQSDNTFLGANSTGTTLFDNFGTFLKSGNTGVTTLDSRVVFNNTGAVSAQNGTLDIVAGGTSSNGNYTTTGGGIINLTGFTFTNSTTFAGNGNFVSNAAFGGTVAGILNWPGQGTQWSGVMTLLKNGVLNISGAGSSAYFDGLVLSNYGTVNWTNTTLEGVLDVNAQIYNYGVWNAQSDNIFKGANSTGTTLFDNYGTFVKTGNTGTTTLDGSVVFNNSGTVNVESGTLDIGGGTSSGGSFTTTNGASLNFIDAAYNFTNTTTFTGVGNVVTTGANFGGTIAGTLNWNGGNLTGFMILASNSLFEIAGTGGTLYFDGFTLTNFGTVNWTNTTLEGLYNTNAQIYNYGVWNAQSDNTFVGANSLSNSYFYNYATFRKTGNAGATILDAHVIFNNTGAVSVQSGTLEIEGGGTNSGSGTFVTTNGALLALDNLTFANSATITSSTVVNLGGNTTVNGVLTATNLQLIGGTLGGTNVLAGILTWSGGTMTGVMTVASNSVLNIASASNTVYFDGFALTNYGTVNWTNTTLEGLDNTNGQIYNYGLWNAQSDNTFVGANSLNTSLFDNFGTFLKSGNAGVTTFDSHVVFNNTGTVSVQSGTLDIVDGGTNNNGSFATASNGIINLSGFTFTNVTTFIGNSNFLGNSVFGGTIVGTVNWPGGGTQFSGVMTLLTNSVLNIAGAGSYAYFDGFTLTNYGTVNWTNATLEGLYNTNAQIYNYGLWNAQSDNIFKGANSLNTSLFDNFGTFLKSGNTGATTLDGSVVFNNMGAVYVQSGTLDIGGGASSGGDFTTASGASLNFIDAAYNFTNTTTFTGVGSVLTTGADFGGTIAGTLGWNGGNLTGFMVLATNSVFDIVGTGATLYLDGFTLTNYGTVNWTNTTLEGLYNTNAWIYNYGLWNAQSDNTFVGANSESNSFFYNYGTFRKSGNTGSTTLDAHVVFLNGGTLDSQMGNITLGGAYTLGAGILNFGLSSSTNYGTVTLPGTAALGGVITANFKNGYLPALGGSFPIVQYGSRVGTFANVVLPYQLAWVTNYTANSFTLQVFETSSTPAQFEPPQLSANNFSFSFPTVNGQSYTVQENTSLSTTNWVTLTNITGNGSFYQIAAPATNSPGLFFRVREP